MYGRWVVPLNERGGSGHVRGAPLDYLSFPCFGGLVFSYVFSILSIALFPSRIMYFSPPPLAPAFGIYVPLNIGPFAILALPGFFASCFSCGRALRAGFFLTYTPAFTVTPPAERSELSVHG